MALASKSKVTLTDFNPSQIKARGDDVQRLKLGILIGRGVSIVKRKSPDGQQEFIGLGGAFEAYFEPTPDGYQKPPVASSVLFAPDWFQSPILALLSDVTDKKTGEVVTEGAEAVNFAHEIWVTRAKNPQGYEWTIQPLNDPAPDTRDPLEDMRQFLPEQYRPALLAAPKTEPAGEQSAASAQEQAPASGGKNKR